jgi:hypothetical protein
MKIRLLLAGICGVLLLNTGCGAKLEGKKITLTAPCRVSLGAHHVHVEVQGKDLMVELPQAYQRKFTSGARAWIGLTGSCHIEPQGGPDSQEQADGYIAVEKVHFFDQADGHSESLKIVGD